ncbi:MAG TPA: M28 family peptidase [Acidobacteriota bacterium]|nr:M28 family peptidase [Acidobacteriota bacterium]
MKKNYQKILGVLYVKKRRVILISQIMKYCRTVFALILVCISFAESEDTILLDGFSPQGTKQQREFEKRLKENISASKIESHLKWLTSFPHRAGTDGAKKTADYILQHLKDYGFETEMVRYEAYLPAPISTKIRLIKPVEEDLPVTEEKIAGDPFTEFVNDHPGWNGYSPSGEAQGQIVYAHHGSAEDIDTLQKLGVDLKGKILLMRYFRTGEGTKVQNAEKAGAAAVVLYADPAEDGFRYGEVYPNGDWRPPGSIMRRSILNLPYSGDPLSPGIASVDGAKRLRPEDVALPKIPVLPVSYRTAEKILKLLEGNVAPYPWQGALGLTYKIGPGPAEAYVQTKTDNRDRPMWNVIARLKGNTDPDQWVIVGNHHDAWIFGAGDPSSGTASLLSLAESIGKLAKQGLRPKRTIILTFWDAEEMILGGSTEWVEDRQKDLLDKAVAYINMDSAVFNTTRPLSVSSHPVLHSLFRAASRDIQDPKSKRSLFEVWTEMQNQYRKVPGVDGWGEFFNPDQTLEQPYVFERPYDDAEPFFSLLALPASDMYYGADYGMYHSIYENYHWMKTVVDPTFEYHKLMAELQGTVALRLANAELIPLDYAVEANHWRLAYEDLEQNTEEKDHGRLKIDESLSLIDQWESEAKGLLEDQRSFLKNFAKSKKDYSAVNRMIYLISRDFYDQDGIGQERFDRNLFSGSAGMLPGLRSEPPNVDQYIAALKQRVASLQSARKQLK